MDINRLTREHFEEVLFPVQDDLRINDLGNYTDDNGITHIYVSDIDKAWELLNGEWVEKAPF